MTKQQLYSLVTNGAAPNEIAAAILEYNPRGTYDYIQKTQGWPLPTWLDGFEKSPENKSVMLKYLLDKMALFANKSQFLLSMLQGIPSVDPTK